MESALKTAGLAALSFVALAACEPKDGTFIQKAEAKANKTVDVAQGTKPEGIANQLRAMGFGINRITGNGVSATARGGAVVDCGRISQYRDGNKSIYAGSTPVSVLYLEPESPDFLTRQIAVLSHVNVGLAGDRATVAERHEITMLWSASDGSGSKRESKAVNAGETVTFADGTVCATGTRVADNLR